MNLLFLDPYDLLSYVEKLHKYCGRWCLILVASMGKTSVMIFLYCCTSVSVAHEKLEAWYPKHPYGVNYPGCGKLSYSIQLRKKY